MIAFIKSLSVVDWLTFSIAAFMVLRGFRNGCSGEIGRLIGVLAAVAAGVLGVTPVSRAVLSFSLASANQQAGRMIVFIIMLVACFSICLLVSHLLADGIQMVLRQPFDMVVGGVIGGIKAFVLIIVVCMFEIMQPKPADQKDETEKSLTTQKMLPLIRRIKFFE